MLRFLCLALAFLAHKAAADPLSAVGRIEKTLTIGGCTATLVTPDIVVTAAHCVRGHTPAQFAFRLGDGRDLAPIPLKEFQIHPLYEQTKDNPAWRLRFDFAVARLARPVLDIRAFPLATGTEAEQGEELLIVSWRRGGGNLPERRACPVIDGIEGLVTLDCPVQGGESGAPVLRETADGYEIVAVISSKRQLHDRTVALASDIRRRLEPMLNALD